ASSSAEVEDDQGTRWGSGQVRLTRIELLDARGAPTEQVRTGDAVTFRLNYDASEPVEHPVFGLGVYTLGGVQVTGPNTREAGVVAERIEGTGAVDLHVDPMLLLPGSYVVSATCTDDTLGHTYDSRH